MNNIKFPIQFLMFCLLFTLVACTEDEPVVALAPTSDNAKFSYTIDPDNANRIIFTGQPDVDTWFMHWNFGDQSAAEGLEAEKLYYLKGDYEVRFKIFTEGGTAETVQTISIAEDIVGSNLLENGEFESDQGWTVLPISGGVDVAFENGAATFTGGSWGHVGIYQAIEVEANTTYQINMNIAGEGMTDCWFEVYLGTSPPVEGSDYTDGGIRLGLNTWDGCGSDPFDAPLTTISCSNGGGDGTFELPNTTTAYFVIRSGGANLGSAGVTIDNVTIRPL